MIRKSKRARRKRRNRILKSAGAIVGVSGLAGAGYYALGKRKPGSTVNQAKSSSSNKSQSNTASTKPSPPVSTVRETFGPPIRSRKDYLRDRKSSKSRQIKDRRKAILDPRHPKAFSPEIADALIERGYDPVTQTIRKGTSKSNRALIKKAFKSRGRFRQFSPKIALFASCYN
jgi:hypothetical protein